MLYSTILYMFSEQSFLILLEEMESSERREEGVAAEYSDVLSQQTNVWGRGWPACRSPGPLLAMYRYCLLSMKTFTFNLLSTFF